MKNLIVLISYFTASLTAYGASSCGELLDYLMTKEKVGGSYSNPAANVTKINHKKPYSVFNAEVDKIIHEREQEQETIDKERERINRILIPLKKPIEKYTEIQNELDIHTKNIELDHIKNDPQKVQEITTKIESLRLGKEGLESIYGKDVQEVRKRYGEAYETFSPKPLNQDKYSQRIKKLSDKYGVDENIGHNVFHTGYDKNAYHRFESISNGRSEKIRAYYDENNKLVGAYLKTKEGYEALQVKDLSSGCYVSSIKGSPDKNRPNTVTPDYCFSSPGLEEIVKKQDAESKEAFYKAIRTDYPGTSLKELGYSNYQYTQELCNSYSKYFKIESKPITPIGNNEPGTIEQ